MPPLRVPGVQRLYNDPWVITLIDSLPMHVALLDVGGTIQAVNGRWNEFARRNGGDECACGVGVNYLRVCSGEEAESPIRDVLAGRRATYEVEYPCHGPQEKHWFIMRISPLGVDPRAGFIVMHEDVTKHALTRDVIEKQRANLQTLLETATDGIHVTNERGNLVYFSDSFARMLGYSNLEMPRLTAADWEVAHTDVQFESEFARLAACTDFQSRQFRRRDGSVIQVEVHEKSIMMDGRRYLYRSARDITQRLNEERRMTAERRHLAELERINRELDEFVYIASHDLRSPLRAITSLTQWVIDDDRTIRPETADRLRQVQRRAQRMSRLLDDILLYARAGKIDSVSGERLAADGLVREVVETLHIPDGFVVRCDPSLSRAQVARMPLKQVLHNLIGNAIKHHDRTVGTIEVRVNSAGNRHLFSVSDDGPGIPEQFRESVFDMFTTLKPRDTVEGSGMGLALVRKIVASVGGNCGLESCGARGTCLWFDWPKGDPT